MLRRDPKYVAELKKAAAEFSKALAVVAMPLPTLMPDIAARSSRNIRRNFWPGPIPLSRAQATDASDDEDVS